MCIRDRYMPSELVINSMMSGCQEEMDKITERFESYITRFSDKFFTDDAEKIRYRDVYKRQKQYLY